jgi:hypothetical protein
MLLRMLLVLLLVLLLVFDIKYFYKGIATYIPQDRMLWGKSSETLPRFEGVETQPR